ncbi:MAG TPA: hypothetical protein VFL85_00395 [Candidatus Saccharimonadales bacterium]|nr:hypothetical protein [Candidatus Saccharimonadales bacterium]
MRRQLCDCAAQIINFIVLSVKPFVRLSTFAKSFIDIVKTFE